MGRMEKYEEEKPTILSRTSRNEDLYKDVYLNNTIVDLNNILSDNEEVEEHREEVVIEKEIRINQVYYEEHQYNINEYLQEKREKLVDDKLPRSLNERIKEDENEISKLVSLIEEKSKNEDLFTELLPDDENTIITDANDEKLNNYIGETAIDNFVMNKDMNETNSFIDIDDTTKINKTNKVHKTRFKVKPIVALIFSFSILVIVILYLIFR